MSSDPTLLAAMNAVQFPIATAEVQKSFLAIRKYLLSLTNLGGFKTATCMLGPVASFFDNEQLLEMNENKCRDEENALQIPIQAGVRPNVVVPPEPEEPDDIRSISWSIYNAALEKYHKAMDRKKTLVNVTLHIAQAMRKALQPNHPHLAALGLDSSGLPVQSNAYFFNELTKACLIDVSYVDSQLEALHFPAYASTQFIMAMSTEFANLFALRSSIGYGRTKAEIFDHLVRLVDYNEVAKAATVKYIRDTPTANCNAEDLFRAILSDIAKPALNPPPSGSASAARTATEATLTAEVNQLRQQLESLTATLERGHQQPHGGRGRSGARGGGRQGGRGRAGGRGKFCHLHGTGSHWGTECYAMRDNSDYTDANRNRRS